MERLLEDIAKQVQELHEESEKLVGKYRLSKSRDDTKSLMRELVAGWAAG